MLQLGDVLRLDNPVDQIRMASAPDGARFVDEAGTLWRKQEGHLIPTLKGRVRPARADNNRMRLYALPGSSEQA